MMLTWNLMSPERIKLIENLDTSKLETFVTSGLPTGENARVSTE